MLKFVIPSTLTGVLVGGLAMYSIRTDSVSVEEVFPHIPAGQKILEDYACGEGETKLTYVKGVIDDFSTAWEEKAFLGVPDELLKAGEVQRLLAFNTDYDSFSADNVVADIFVIPTDIESGIIVSSFRPLNGGAFSDVLRVGSLTGLQTTDAAKAAPLLATDPSLRPVSYLASNTKTPHPSWETFRTEGSTYKIPLSQLKLVRANGATYSGSEFSILDLLQNSPVQEFPLLTYLSEDHTVDYFALSVCKRPARNYGGTFWSAHDTLELNDLSWDGAGLSCWTKEAAPACNTDKGDTSCKESHPIACFRDTGDDPPEALAEIVQVWTGGWIEFTEPVRGESLKTLSDANAKCRSRFGADWRVLSGIETGGGTPTLLGYGTPLEEGKRAWVDTPGAPYGTCWDRTK